MSGARMLALTDAELVEACMAVVQAAAAPTGAAPPAACGQQAAHSRRPPPGKAALFDEAAPEPAAAAGLPPLQPCLPAKSPPATQAAAPVIRSLFTFEALFGGSDPTPANLTTPSDAAPPQQQQQQQQQQAGAPPLEDSVVQAAPEAEQRAVSDRGGMEFQEAETQPIDLTALDSD
jgi:hypothetical protein